MKDNYMNEIYGKLFDNSIKMQDMNNDLKRIESILFELHHTTLMELHNIKENHPSNYIFRTYAELNEKYGFDFIEPEESVLKRRYVEMYYLITGRYHKTVMERNDIIGKL